MGARALAAAAALLALSASAAAGQPVTGERGRTLDQIVRHSATGLALPNEPIDADLGLTAGRATSWHDQGVQHALLERGVRVSIGAYEFRAERAVVMLTPRRLPGRAARDVAVYLDRVTEVGRGPVRQEGRRLLVTAVLTGRVRLTTDVMRDEPAEADPLVVEARERVERHRRALREKTVDVPEGPPLFGPEAFERRAAREAELRRPEPVRPELLDIPEAPAAPETPEPPPPPDAAPLGEVDFHAGRVVVRSEEHEGYILLSDGVQVMYTDAATDTRISLRADKAVIFTDPRVLDDPAGRTTEAAAVRGIYLEDNVIATDGEYTFRGPRVFYDVAEQRAVVLDAVFYTWDVDRQVPLYIRAEQLRQHSERQWSATGARLTTSEFAEPHFSIGARSLTIEAEPRPDGTTRHRFEAEGITARLGPNVGEIPVFYWPGLVGAGAPQDVPIRGARAGVRSRRGATLETRWDLFGLLGQDRPDGFDATLLADGFTDRGAGIGIDADYDVDNAFGDLETYYLFDRGRDRPGGRESVDPPSDHRGRVLWRHRHHLIDGWEATAEAAWLSDPTFLEEWWPGEARAEKQYETLFHLKQQRDDWAFTFLAKYDLLDFVPQTDRLQGRGNILDGDPQVGFTTDKLPELAYYRVNTPLWADRLSWYSENRASVMRLNLPRDTPAERGFTPAQTVALFGMAGPDNIDQPFSDALHDTGLDESTRLRGDTRQEVRAPLEAGILNVTPYVTGRATAYDDGFEDFSGDDENVRLWGAAGVRIGTSFSRAWGDVRSGLLDVNRLRHVIEPDVHLFFADTTIEQQDLPVYDYDVESLSDGTTASFGIVNTLQTQRGGAGRWRSVDWLRLDTRFVTASGDTVRESPIARFFDSRPEQGLHGDHAYNQLAWRVSDTLAFVGDTNYSFDSNRLERWNLGLTMDHTPRLTTFATYRDIRALDSSIVRYGADYLLTTKYHVGFSQSLDVNAGRSRNVTLTLTRRLPRWLLIMAFDFDSIDDVTSFGVALAPEGLGGPAGVGRNPFANLAGF